MPAKPAASAHPVPPGKPKAEHRPKIIPGGHPPKLNPPNLNPNPGPPPTLNLHPPPIALPKAHFGPPPKQTKAKAEAIPDAKVGTGHMVGTGHTNYPIVNPKPTATYNTQAFRFPPSPLHLPPPRCIWPVIANIHALCILTHDTCWSSLEHSVKSQLYNPSARAETHYLTLVTTLVSTGTASPN